MFKNLIKNKRGQNTAEYALLIALVVAGIIAMQTFAQRSLQARVKDAAGTYMVAETAVLGNSQQYEPYYAQSNYTVNRESAENKRLATGLVEQDSASTRTRTGSQTTAYTNTTTGF